MLNQNDLASGKQGRCSNSTQWLYSSQGIHSLPGSTSSDYDHVPLASPCPLHLPFIFRIIVRICPGLNTSTYGICTSFSPLMHPHPCQPTIGTAILQPAALLTTSQSPSSVLLSPPRELITLQPPAENALTISKSQYLPNIPGF